MITREKLISNQEEARNFHLMLKRFLFFHILEEVANIKSMAFKESESKWLQKDKLFI